MHMPSDPTVLRQSRLSAAHLYNNRQCVVAILRKEKHDDRDNTQHAFIVVEMADNMERAADTTHGFYRRYDLYIDRHEQRDGDGNLLADVVATPTFDSAQEWVICRGAQDVEVEFNRNIMHGLEPDQKFYGFAFSVSVEQVVQLHENIRQSSEQQIPYEISGHEASGPRSRGVQGAHSCYTWARQQLNRLTQLDGEPINIKAPFLNSIISIPSLSLKQDLREEPQARECVML